MTPNLSAMAAELAQAQTYITQLTNRKQAASAIHASALSQRPAGIPASWQPDYILSAGTASVKAWFDPNHYGNQLTPRS